MKSFNESYDLVSNINKIHKDLEPNILQTHLNKLSLEQTEIDDKILKDFIKNEKYYISILKNYDGVTQVVKDIKKLLKNQKDSLEYKEIDSFIDKKKVEMFKQVMNQFVDDMDRFITEKRYLVDYDTFKMNNKTILVVISNDLIFLGEKDEIKYNLLDGMYKSMVKMSAHKNKLIIKLPNKEYIMTKTFSAVENILSAFEEISHFKIENKIKSKIDNDYIEYLVETENYEELKNIKFQGKKILPRKIYDEKDLLLWSEIEQQEFFSLLDKILLENFQNRIKHINKDITTTALISESFDIFYEFFHQEINLIKELKINEPLVITVRRQLIFLIDFLSKRIFFKRNKKQKITFYIKLMEDKLQWDGNSFKHLLKIIDPLREEFYNKKFIESLELLDRLITEYQ
ncbi:hypothetical protein SLOPH_1809 [Spraguea lophii 42_110]|uniref:Uncharacterized protein n=1 Tax=Spraguea lophii (strain 42_110) TaxID=1358809 RepID=S7XFR0_SPRLO|nr:hypothetical protein SLOPH_1809 [Spraguea lophii 42_110]